MTMNNYLDEMDSSDCDEGVDMSDVLHYQDFDEWNFDRSPYDDSGYVSPLPSTTSHMVTLESPLYHAIPTIPNMYHILNEFYCIRASKEIQKYEVSRVPDLDTLNFIFGGFSLDQIYRMSQTTLWRLHCVYGRKIRKIICRYLNRPLPVVPKRKCKKNCNAEMNEVNHESDVIIPRTSPRKQVAVHEFCIDILQEPFYAKTRSLLRWMNEKELTFSICDKDGLSTLWRKVKDNSVDSAENFGRAIRFSRSKSEYFVEMRPQPKKTRQFTQGAFTDHKKKKYAFQRECESMAKASIS
jgi:hypothetical protein